MGRERETLRRVCFSPKKAEVRLKNNHASRSNNHEECITHAYKLQLRDASRQNSVKLLRLHDIIYYIYIIYIYIIYIYYIYLLYVFYYIYIFIIFIIILHFFKFI